MAWVQKPPETAVSGEFFNVTYAVFASDGFYQYAVQNGILSHRYYLLSCFHCHEYMVILYVHTFFITLWCCLSNMLYITSQTVDSVS